MKLLDCAAAPIAAATAAANPETAPEDGIADMSSILFPISTITRTPSSRRKADSAKARGRGKSKVERASVGETENRTIPPEAASKKAAAKVAIPVAVEIAPKTAAKCVASEVKAALENPVLKEASKTELELQKASSAQAGTSNENRFVCFHCNYACRRKCDLENHIVRVHLKLLKTGGEELKCSYCGRSYASRSAFRCHIVRQHLSPNDDVSAGAPTPSRKNCGYCCDVCGRGFENEREMLAHRQVYHATAQPMFWSAFQASKGMLKQCANCARLYRLGRFSDKHMCEGKEEDTALEERARALLRSAPNFRCDSCSLSFIWKLMLRKHRGATHPDAAPLDWNAVNVVQVPHYCGACFMAFDEVTAVAEHECVSVDTQAQRKPHICQHCGRGFRRNSERREHCRLKHGIVDEERESAATQRQKVAVRCPYCDVETAITRNQLMAHIKEAHNIDTETPFACFICNKMFKLKSTLTAHDRTFHPKDEDAAENERILRENQILLNGEPAYHCNACNRHWPSGIRFLAHHRMHSAERKFTCDLCGKQMRTHYLLQKHIQNIHQDIRNHSCDICDKSFHTRQACEEHRRIHTGEKPFACEICGRTFVALNALFTHKRVHNDFFPHACHLCPKKFKVRRSLTLHIRRHTGERPFKCDLCAKTFNSSSRFSYHKKVTHSDNRPFRCQLCGSQFKANRFLTRHMKLHETRTHIHFKRRNNPEFFAAKDGATAAANKAGTEEAHRVPESKDDADNVSALRTLLWPQSDRQIIESGARLDPAAPSI